MSRGKPIIIQLTPIAPPNSRSPLLSMRWSSGCSGVSATETRGLVSFWTGLFNVFCTVLSPCQHTYSSLTMLGMNNQCRQNNIPVRRCAFHDVNTVPKALQHQRNQQYIQALQESFFFSEVFVFIKRKGEFVMVPELEKAHGNRAFRRWGDWLWCILKHATIVMCMLSLLCETITQENGQTACAFLLLRMWCAVRSL